MQYYQKIKVLREEAGKTQKEIAEILETTQTYYAKYEAGKHQMPIYQLIRLADLYNVSLDWICGRTTKREVNY